jgi:hypothetical protein
MEQITGSANNFNLNETITKATENAARPPASAASNVVFPEPGIARIMIAALRINQIGNFRKRTCLKRCVNWIPTAVLVS